MIPDLSFLHSAGLSGSEAEMQRQAVYAGHRLGRHGMPDDIRSAAAGKSFLLEGARAAMLIGCTDFYRGRHSSRKLRAFAEGTAEYIDNGGSFSTYTANMMIQVVQATEIEIGHRTPDTISIMRSVLMGETLAGMKRAAVEILTRTPEGIDAFLQYKGYTKPTLKAPKNGTST